jgi:voltage-gated potassium channel
MLPAQISRPVTHAGSMILALVLLLGLSRKQQSSRISLLDRLYPFAGILVILDQAFWAIGGLGFIDGGQPLLVLWAFFAVLSAIRLVYFLGLEKRVNADVLQGAIAGYLMLGLIAGMIYSVMEYLVPGSFLHANLHSDAANVDFASLNYYAFSCLSTVGFGDIIVTNHPAEMLSVVVALIGPVYLAVVMGVLIARITASGTSAEVETSLTESDAHKNTI